MRHHLIPRAPALALAAALALAGPNAAVAAPTTPEALLSALDSASRTGDAAAADALVTDDFRYAGPLSGERLVAELTRTRAGLVPVGARTRGRRAALTVRIGEAPRVLLVTEAKDGWRVDGLALTAEAAASFLAGSPMRPPREERLLLAGGALSAALSAGDTDGALGWMSPAFAEAKRDGGRDLIAQLTRKGLTLRPLDARALKETGALMADVMRGDRAVDRIWLLARRGPDKIWRFEAITEDPARVDATLAGRIPARFDPRRLPSEPGAEAAVAALRGALAAGQGAAAVALLGPPVADPPGIGQPRARRWLTEVTAHRATVSPAAVHVDRQSGRGAARLIVSTARGEKGRSDETVWLYLLRSGGAWAVVDLNFGLTARWFYPPKGT